MERRVFFYFAYWIRQKIVLARSSQVDSYFSVGQSSAADAEKEQSGDLSFSMRKRYLGELAIDLSHIFCVLSLPSLILFKKLYLTCILCSIGFLLIAFFTFKVKVKKPDLLFYCFAGFYAIQLLGLFRTDNYQQGLAELETSSAVLAFPSVYFLTRPIRDNLRNFALTLIIITAFLACLICHTISLIEILDANLPLSTLWSTADYQYLSLSGKIRIHPSYMSILVIVAIFVLVKFKLKTANYYRRLLLLILLFYFVAFLLLLTSRGPWIAFFGSSVLIALIYLRSKYFIGVVLFLFLIFISANVFFEPVQSRFLDPLRNLVSPSSRQINNLNTLSANFHLNSWRCAIQVVDSPMTLLFGAGVGDEIDVLVQCYTKSGFSEMVQQRFNSHNDYLSQFVKGGIFASGYLILILYFIMRRAVERGNIALFYVTSLLAIAFFFESYLNVRLGIFYFSFFIPFFSSQPSFFQTNRPK